MRGAGSLFLVQIRGDQGLQWVGRCWKTQIAVRSKTDLWRENHEPGAGACGPALRLLLQHRGRARSRAGRARQVPVLPATGCGGRGTQALGFSTEKKQTWVLSLSYWEIWSWLSWKQWRNGHCVHPREANMLKGFTIKCFLSSMTLFFSLHLYPGPKEVKVRSDVATIPYLAFPFIPAGVHQSLYFTSFCDNNLFCKFRFIYCALQIFPEQPALGGPAQAWGGPDVPKGAFQPQPFCYSLIP